MVPGSAVLSPRRLILPLALAQFICSFAGSNMNVMITDISDDLDTTVKGVQTAITLFLLIMAILMIPCSKLTDRWGRKRCFIGGLTLYGVGALLSAVSPGLGVLILGNSVLRGRRHGAADPARLHPRDDVVHRSHLACLGLRRDQRAGRHRRRGRAVDRRCDHHGDQLAGRVRLPGRRSSRRSSSSAVASSIRSRPTRRDPSTPSGRSSRPSACSSSSSGSCRPAPTTCSWRCSSWSASRFLVGFFLYIRARERAGKEPLLSTGLFRNRMCNLALVTQNMQWLLLMGVSFVVSVFLQEVRGYSAIETGVIFTAATVGILVSSFAAERLAKRYSQRTLIVAGFVVTLAGIGLLIGLVHASSKRRRLRARASADRPRLGVMLTPSVNVVQSSFPEELQGEISGLSRSVSNLGSTFGTAIAGTILVSVVAHGNPVVRGRDDRPRRVRAHRSRGGPAPPCQDREGVDPHLLGGRQRTRPPVESTKSRSRFSRARGSTRLRTPQGALQNTGSPSRPIP